MTKAGRASAVMTQVRPNGHSQLALVVFIEFYKAEWLQISVDGL